MAANNPTVYPMPPANADLATTWAFLEEGVDHIMTKLQTGVSYSKYMALYTVSYNYCTSSKMHGGGETLGMAGRSKSSKYRHSPHTLPFFSFTLLSDAAD